MAWTWKDKVASGLPLRYEPGNWGDILKGEWLCLLLQWFRRAGSGAVRYVDPFCGAPDYPLTEATRARLQGCQAPNYQRFCQAGRLLSSASLARAQAAELGLAFEAHCSDREADPVRALEAEAELPCESATALILFDPYDYFERWPEWNERLLKLSETRSLLLYLYNKSPRGASQFRQYQSLRQRWRGKPYVVGRVPSDALLPRAWHEVWLAGPFAQRDDLREQLQQAAWQLAQPLLQQGVWEESTP